MAIKTLTTSKLTWINIDTVDGEALDFLKKNHKYYKISNIGVAFDSLPFSRN